MVILKDNDIAQVSGGIDVLNATHTGAQIGGVVGPAYGFFIFGLVQSETMRAGTMHTLGRILLGTVGGFYVGVTAFALTAAACAIAINTTSETVDLIYSN